MSLKKTDAQRLLLAFLMAMLPLLSSAQEEEKSFSLKGMPLKERLIFGGGFGLSFSSVQDNFSVSPMVGYRINRIVNAGATLTWRYSNYKIYNPPIKLSHYGASPFVQVLVYKNIFLWGEYEWLSYEIPGETFRANYKSLLAGGGIVQPIGRANIFIIALYNFSYAESLNAYSPYSSPLVIRTGISLGGFGF